MAKNYYDIHSQRFITSTLDIDMSPFYQEFEKYLNKNGYILDFGCGPGRDLLYFKQQRYKVLGIDNSAELVKFARQYCKCDVLLLDFRELSFNNEFDAIWASASLLHLKKSELKGVLSKALIALKRKGVFYMSFKYGDYEGIRNGRLFLFLNEQVFNDIINDFNIDILEIWKTKDLRKDRENEYWLNVILRKK